MINASEQQLSRDMELSVFGKILATLCRHFEKVETVIFHDSLGETIDYYSQGDPYQTRVMGAHHGLIFYSAKARLKWLRMGEVKRVDTYSSDRESVTVHVGEDTCVTIIAMPGTLDDESFDGLLDHMLNQLREEAGY